MITYTFALKESDIKQLHALLKQTYWANARSCDAVRQSLLHSVVIIARDGDGSLVGSARAVTDQATYSWICDVVVAEAFRGQGIGTQLITRLLEDPRVACTRKILVTKDAQDLYRQHGFQTHPYACMIAYEDASP